MSRDIWTGCAGPSRVAPLSLTPWRVVEAQHKVSTRRLVDTLEEQELLEDIVDEVKPRKPAGQEFEGLHYLLVTPFRHPPLTYGSRFGSAVERSLWYGAQKVETSLAEKAYYQLLFLAGTKAVLRNFNCDWTAFQAEVVTPRGVDLTAAPFAARRAEISSPSSYAASQPLGSAMRAAGVAAAVFQSARCPRRGKAVALFAPAFANPSPGPLQTWKCIVTPEGCEVVHMNGTQTIVFPRSGFEIRGALPAPSVGSA